MPLEIMVGLVVCGIAGIALALHLTGHSRGVVLTHETARQGWLRQFPDNAPTAVRLSSDARAALVECGDGAGVVWAFGADTVAKPLASATLTGAPPDMRLRFPDFGVPNVSLRLAPDEVTFWQERIPAK